MKKVAFIFPGQGSQSVGMGHDLYENFETAKHVFEKADEVLGKSISKICFEGPEEDLKQTINTQPAILTTSIAALEALKSKLDITPAYAAGHSLGEYAAYYATGAVSLENALKLIQKRAELMDEVKGGSMAAVLNSDEETIKECISQSEGYVAIANYNSPKQIVITGDDNAVKQTCELLTAKGVRRVVPLAVSGAFHSEFMKDAGEKFAEFIQNIEVNNTEIAVVTNVDAEFTTSNFKEKMPKQIYSSVQWTQSVEKMIAQGVDTFIEFGNGTVLAGLNKKINPEVTTLNVYDKESLENTIKVLSEV
ncbi:ACP S-malonyltransferase [bacterium]|nr:ACP S-malonyltransferase [bacterium]